MLLILDAVDTVELFILAEYALLLRVAAAHGIILTNEAAILIEELQVPNSLVLQISRLLLPDGILSIIRASLDSGNGFHILKDNSIVARVTVIIILEDR